MKKIPTVVLEIVVGVTLGFLAQQCGMGVPVTYNTLRARADATAAVDAAEKDARARIQSDCRKQVLASCISSLVVENDKVEACMHAAANVCPCEHC